MEYIAAKPSEWISEYADSSLSLPLVSLPYMPAVPAKIGPVMNKLDLIFISRVGQNRLSERMNVYDMID